MDLSEYLESKDLRVKRGGGTNLYTHCPFCNEDTSKRGRLYIQADPESEMYGAFFCHLCQTKGGLDKIRAHFGDPPLSEYKIGSRLMRTVVDYYSERLLENPEAYRYLSEARGLTHETIKSARFGWADGGLVTHLVASGFPTEEIYEAGLINAVGQDFLRDKLVIPYFEYGQPVAIRGKVIGGKYLSMPGSSSRLYGIDAVRGQETVCVAAGEFDSLVLNQLGFAACGTPGEQQWKPEWTEALTDARRIFILYDPDTAGKTGAEKLATLLGPRCRVVELPEPKIGQKIDVSYLHVEESWQREDFEFAMSKAKGGLLVSPAQAFDRWLEFEGNPDLQGLRFNIPVIDNEMQHGLLPGQVVTLTARTNSGKTVFSLNVLHRMRMLKPDINILFMSLEQTRNEWFERAHRILNFYEPGSTTRDTIDWWKDNLFIVDENRITEDVLEMCIEQYIYERGVRPDLILIDYLGYYARGFPGEEYARMTSAIMGLKAIAKRNQVVFFVPHQANRSNDMGREVRLDQGRGAGTVEETSDLGLTMWTPDQGEGIQSKFDQNKEIMVKMAKSRDGGVNTLAVLQGAPLTLAIVPQNEPVYYERALRELKFWRANLGWQEAVNMHKSGSMKLDMKNKG